MGKNGRKMEFGRKMPEKWENCHFLAIFPPILPVLPKSIFRPFFPHFRPEAGGPKWGLFGAIRIATLGHCQHPIACILGVVKTVLLANGHLTCLGDTHNLRHFRRFPRSEEKSPLFSWVECNTSICTDFRQTHLLSAGEKTTVTQTTNSTTLTLV